MKRFKTSHFLTLLVLATSLCATSVALSTPAMAIVGGESDKQRHQQVGLIYAAQGPQCSGVLLAPKVVATVANCDTEVEKHGGNPRITFDTTPDANSKFYSGKIYTHPRATYPKEGFKGWDNLRYDYAVLILDEGAKGIEPVRLPRPGASDRLKRQHASLHAVGYGFTGFDKDGKPTGGPDQRRVTDLPFAEQAYDETNKNNEFYLQLGTPRHTTCIGDAGGPAFAANDKLLALSSGGASLKCNDRGYFARLDIPIAQNFYKSYLEKYSSSDRNDY